MRIWLQIEDKNENTFKNQYVSNEVLLLRGWISIVWQISMKNIVLEKPIIGDTEVHEIGKWKWFDDFLSSVTSLSSVMEPTALLYVCKWERKS